MPAVSSGAREGIVIASGVLVLTAVFAWRQWAERRSRDEDLSADDLRYFSRRDVRRAIGNVILGVIGIGMIVGSLLNPRVPAHQIPFLWVWLSIGVLALVLIVLALLDWSANLRYAARHRRLLIEERLKLIEDEYKKRTTSTSTNSNGNGIAH